MSPLFGDKRARSMANAQISQPSSAENSASLSGVYVDMGTTNTRVWRARGSEILARAQAAIGIRDSAREGSFGRVRGALRELIAQVSEPSKGTAAEGPEAEPSFVAARE